MNHITLHELQSHTRLIIDALERHDIRTLDDLSQAKHRAGMSVHVSPTSRLHITYQPSKRSTRAYIISYWLDGELRPTIELRINSILDYTLLLLTCSTEVDGFTICDTNEVGDHIQDRTVRGGSLNAARDVLLSLLPL